MYHSLTFQNADGVKKNTWDDWRLIPTAKPSFSMPEAQLKYVDVPGGASIDLSTYLTGDIHYSDRTGSFDFVALDTEEDWDSRCNDIAKFLHGKRITVETEDDPYYKYVGRITMKKNANGKIPTITFDYRVNPYKIHITGGDLAF